MQLCALPIVGMARGGELFGDCLACLPIRSPLPLQPLAPQLVLEHSVHRMMRACCLVRCDRTRCNLEVLVLVLPQRGGTTHAFGKSLRSLHSCKQRAALQCPRHCVCPRIRSTPARPFVRDDALRRRARPFALMWTRRGDALQCPRIRALVVILAHAAILSSTRLSIVAAEDAARTCTNLRWVTDAGTCGRSRCKLGTCGRGWKLIVGGGRCGFGSQMSGVKMSGVIQWLKQRLAQRDDTFLGADDSALEQDVVFAFQRGGPAACWSDPLDSLDG